MFEYGWGNEKEKADFYVHFARSTQKPLAWKDEVHRAARLIAGEAKKPLWLCSSGGLDSEIMCRVFLEEDIPFSVLTVEHTTGTNEHDTRYARKWCEEHGVNQKVVKIDIMQFLDRGVRKYIDQSYIANHLFRYFQIRLLELVEELDGTAILGGGEQVYKIDATENTLTERDTYLEFDPGYAAPLEWCKRNGADHRPYFYFTTPELCLSYLTIPIVDFAVKHPDIFRHKLNASIFKAMVYQAYWPDLEARLKYNGFERIHPQAKDLHRRLTEHFGDKAIPYRLPVQEFRSQLLPEPATK